MEESGHVEYTYNPADPTPSLIDPSENEMNAIGDYRSIDCRDDVICFDGAPVAEPIRLTGEGAVTLFAASDCPDTDFVARLSILTRDGRSIKLAENVVRAKLRNKAADEQLLVSGEVLPVTIPLQMIGVTVACGEKIRLSICSAASNLLFVNGNTGKNMAFETENAIAHNRIYFGKDYPSKIELYAGGGK